MWLLNASTRRLEYFANDYQVPGGYAILSHTWDGEEVTFDEIHTPEATHKAGYKKIEYSCLQTLKDSFTHIWIDTCCIDKRSSAELSEAINSMFRWYAEARVCYAYLADVDVADPLSNVREDVYKQFCTSRWFTRGWTLQELIAPRTVHFYDRHWKVIGAKSQLLAPLHEATGEDSDVLSDREAISLTSVAIRMSWASKRETTRIEDRAYSLLGIFDVNMPLLYGEGRKAFQRLQEEIIGSSAVVDHSILVWKPNSDELAYMSGKHLSVSQLLASSPEGFRDSHDIVSWDLPQMPIFELSSRGLRLTCDVVDGLSSEYPLHDRWQNRPDYCLVLNCRHRNRPSTRIVLPLLKRTRAERFDPEVRYQMVDIEDETLYDREWQLGLLLDFASIHDSSVRKQNQSKSVINLARYRFSYPRHVTSIEQVN